MTTAAATAEDSPPDRLPHGIERRKDDRNAAGLALVLAALLVVGAILRTWQYAANTSLWLDEIALVRGILDRDPLALLTSPLPYDQVAPKGFLLAQKLATTALGASDYVLRLIPYLCSLISLVVFRSLATRTLDGVGPLIATVLFVTAAPLVAFSAVVKQYSVDVCVAVVLWWIAVDLTSRPVTISRAVSAALIGALLIWFSQPGVLMVAALGLVLIIAPRSVVPTSTSGRPSRAIAIIVTAWGLSALAVASTELATLSQTTREYMDRYWADGFPPLSTSRVSTRWPWDEITQLFGSGPGAQAGLVYPIPALYAVAAAAGFGVLWRDNRSAAVLLIAPLVVTLAAAVARLYPFSDRLILFLVPSFMLAIAAAIEGLRRALEPVSKRGAAAIALMLALPAVYPVAATPPVYHNEHVKAILSHVQTHRQPGDAMYAYYGAAPVLSFYASTYGLSRDEYMVGGCHRGESRRYLEELDTFRGRARVWILMTHAVPLYREREIILGYLDTIGTQLEGRVVPSRTVAGNTLPAEVYLYDLAGTNASKRSSPSGFRLRGPSVPHPQLRCGEGPLAMVRSDFK